MPPIKISMKEFAKLFAKFWNEKLLEKEKAITEVCDLPVQYLILLWPQVRKTEDMYHIDQKLRSATTILAILDKIADQIISNPEAICTLEAIGRLQLIFPFLSPTWKEQNASRCKTKLVFWKNAVAFNSKNQRLSVEDYVVECGKQLIKVFYLDWENIQEYISPTIFIALLERVIVMACACKTQLHEMYLPMTLAVDVMCGKAQEVLYQNIMGSNDLAEESLDLLIASIIKVAFQLLKKTTDIEKWIKHAQGDPNTDLHPLVLRLTTLLFTICLNSKDVKLKEFIMGKLQKMFAYQAPELQQLPQSYTGKCRKAFFLISAVGAANDKSLRGLQRAFAKALKIIGDSLVMTVRCKEAPSCKRQDGIGLISTIELDCETDISMKLQALASVYASSETQNRYQMPASFVQLGCETEAAAQNVSTEEDEYNKYMDQTTFPLKVSVEKDLHRLASVITSLAGVVTSLSHHKEGLEQEIQYLDPSHSKHNEYNLQWLKERVNQVQETSNAMHKFEKEVKWLKDHEEGHENQINIRSFANEENSSTNATGNNEVNQESTTFDSANSVAANNEVNQESTAFDSAKGTAASQAYTSNNRRRRRSHKKKRT